ncbi:unnamed protein product [Cochlearia groenlandica]
MEFCSKVTTKKLSSLAKLIQKISYASRHKLITTLDPTLLVKRGKNLRKSLNDAVLTSHAHITCRPSSDHVRSSFVSPVPIQLDYEFSCSSTPPRRSYATTTTRRHVSNGSCRPLMNKSQHRAYIRYNTLPKVRVSAWERHVASAAVFPDVESSSSTGSMESCHVDRAAEEFIQRFHRELRLQKWMMAQEV